MLKQLYNHSSVEEDFVKTLEQYKVYKAIASGGEVALKYSDGTNAMVIGTYNKDEVIYFYNDFQNVTLNNANSIQLLNNELLPNETVNKIQFMIKEALEWDSEKEVYKEKDLSNSVLFINIDAIKGYKVSTDNGYSIYKYETSDDVATKIRYLAIDKQTNDDANEYILVNYYTTN